MNYIAEIKGFQEIAQDKSLSSGQIALWYALMYINNRAKWTQWFTVASSSLESNCGLTRQGIIKNRNVLKQLGLIDFKTNGTKATSYRIIPMADSLQDSIQRSIQDGLQGSLQAGLQNSSTLNKQNQTKLKKENSKRNFSKYTEDPELLKAFESYAQLREKLKKPLTDHALDLVAKKLDELSAPYRDKDRYKREALEQSVLNGWQGVFAVRDFQDTGPERAPLPDGGPRLFSPGDSIEDFL